MQTPEFAIQAAIANLANVCPDPETGNAEQKSRRRKMVLEIDPLDCNVGLSMTAFCFISSATY